MRLVKWRINRYSSVRRKVADFSELSQNIGGLTSRLLINALSGVILAKDAALFKPLREFFAYCRLHLHIESESRVGNSPIC
ncbi:hypothetical protein N7495_007136 [Penicillium taxi]|uniref:uncharacterized protein n=1 Tax=Penicillium taxi TaxID=168475 RepID=UPI0025451FFF|nr:uncharacterized protein N7495_007136 [Penicillium taxi]KAJ5895445.1 hypothetical protein N7495_007136 [Penicillium taxi]